MRIQVHSPFILNLLGPYAFWDLELFGFQEAIQRIYCTSHTIPQSRGQEQVFSSSTLKFLQTNAYQYSYQVGDTKTVNTFMPQTYKKYKNLVFIALGTRNYG